MAPFARVGISTEKWLNTVVCGSFNIATQYAGTNQIRIGLISRVSVDRPGTRFNVRGVNDNGEVANFVETEMVSERQLFM